MSERLVMEVHLADIFNWTLLQSKKGQSWWERNIAAMNQPHSNESDTDRVNTGQQLGCGIDKQLVVIAIL